MQHRPRYRTARWLAAACVGVLVGGCGDYPLDSVGERSNNWIGPIADGVVFLSDKSLGPAPAVSNDVPSTGTAVADPVDVSVRVSEAGR